MPYDKMNYEKLFRMEMYIEYGHCLPLIVKRFLIWPY